MIPSAHTSAQVTRPPCVAAASETTLTIASAHAPTCDPTAKHASAATVQTPAIASDFAGSGHSKKKLAASTPATMMAPTRTEPTIATSPTATSAN